MMKRHSYQYQQRQNSRGSALVVVLLIFALAFALSVDIIYQQHHVQTRTENLLNWDSRYQYAIAAETLAVQALMDDYEDDAENNELLDDCINEKWSGPFVFPYEEAMIGASVQDLQGRFNLNSLVIDNGGAFVRDAEAVSRLEHLLENVLPLSHTTLASQLANEMADWMDTDIVVNALAGAEDPQYRQRRTPNSPIAHESEMRALLSFDKTLAQAIVSAQQEQASAKAARAQDQLVSASSASLAASFWQYFTALPTLTQSGSGAPLLNINTAPLSVLKAYFAPVGVDGAAQKVISERQENPYTLVSDALSLPEFSTLTAAERTALSNVLTVSSQYFQVNIDVSTETGVSRLVTRIQRQPDAPARVFARALQPVLSELEPVCNPD